MTMKKIGRYEIIGRLGRGAMSTVYKAKAPVTGRIVALKILQPRDEIFADLVGEERLKEMFIEEARIMGAVLHDHVAKILDCDEHEGQPFMVLEYFAHSLGALIGEAYQVEAPSRIISAAKTKTYLLQTLKGLERLHFNNIIHRDIKPFNLMLTSDDRVKIIDFGLSRVRGEEKVAIPGMQVGSPYYAAPEQGKDPALADGRADLYSLGILGYRMLTGRLVEKKMAISNMLYEWNPDLSPEWDACIGKALHRDPAQRFASALEMRLQVEKLPLPEKDLCEIGGTERATKFISESEPLRKDPRRIMYKEIRDVLGLDDLLRPKKYYQQDFMVINERVAYEKNSKLYWQRHGAGFPLNWQQAKDYVTHLNLVAWQGCETWRLPTLAEILCVMSPPLHGVECSTWPLFDSSIHWLWSSDHCTKKDAWMVDVVESFFYRLDKDGVGSTCAVSSTL